MDFYLHHFLFSFCQFPPWSVHRECSANVFITAVLTLYFLVRSLNSLFHSIIATSIEHSLFLHHGSNCFISSLSLLLFNKQNVKETFLFVCFLQEVITNEHVVAMMKAAISETEDIPLFVSKKLFFHSFCLFK